MENPMETPGYRLLPARLDYLAETTPNAPFASIPADNTNLSAGYHDVSYAEFGNAVNHAVHWLRQNLPSAQIRFETAAYTGPKDLRYAIIAVALAKLGRRLLLPSPFSTKEAQAHLVKESGCSNFLFGGDAEAAVEGVAKEVKGWELIVMKVPEVEDWLKEERAEKVHYGKSWDEGREDPWLFFHTSGTTGFPKLIPFTQQMMCQLDAASLMSDTNFIYEHVANRRWFCPMPILHFVGMMITLQFTAFGNAVAVLPPPGADSGNPEAVCEIIQYGGVGGSILPPMFIESLVKTDTGLKTLRDLDYVYFAGAPMYGPTAQKLLGHTNLCPAMGTTEAGMYMIKYRNDGEDWEYYSFREANGIEFEHVDGDMYELIFVKKPELKRWQLIFQVYPELDIFHTKDLFVPHKSKAGAWKFAARTDDLVVFSHGKKMNAIDVEVQLAQCPGVSAVVIGGQGRPKPFMLVEWNEPSVDKQTRLDQLWPVAEKVNEKLADAVQLSRDLLLFTCPKKGLVKTPKGTAMRGPSERLYAEEIERLYVN